MYLNLDLALFDFAEFLIFHDIHDKLQKRNALD